MGLFWLRSDNTFAIIALWVLDKASILPYFTLYYDFIKDHEIHPKMSEML